MVKKADAKEVEVDDVMDIIVDDIINTCTFTKEDFLFLVKCLNEDYLELKKKMEEIEKRYNHLKDEAEKR
jgi:hypothetical protein